jgi:DNA-binding response OmpR family regulator
VQGLANPGRIADVSAMADLRSLLVVDDDDAVASVVARAFVGRGWKTHRARTGSEAAAMARGAEPFHAAVVDLVLPGVGGLDVVRELRARQPSCRIVGITGLDDPVMVRAFRAAGADAFVAKPFELDELFAAVDPAAA